MSGINFNKIILLLTLFVFALPVVANQKEAGKTLLTKGSVIGKRSSGSVKLKRRSLVFEKDEIHVGNRGRAQFRMIDQAIISLQENSVLKIRKYRFVKGKDSKNSALLELLSGGLRTITGLIGKGNKKSYELRTPLATIGVRGTDYEVEIVSNGMFVATWEGTIHLKSYSKNGCNIFLGRSQAFMFAFVDKQGRCKGLKKVPNVFKTGHSSNILNAKTIRPSIGLANSNIIDPLMSKPFNSTMIRQFKYHGLNIDQSHPSTKIISESTSIDSPTPIFKVGLELYGLRSDGKIHNYKQSIGGYQVSWGHWDKFSKTSSSNNFPQKGMAWASYKPTDFSSVSARTGTFRYENITDSLLSSSSGQVSNLRVQMDVNFESGDVTNGALSANTKSDTWVAVFDGKINAGDLALQLNGASVIDSDVRTPSKPRDANGFITGDFVGNKAQAVIGSFGLSENGETSNHIEGLFMVK